MPTRVAYNFLIFHVPSMPTSLCCYMQRMADLLKGLKIDAQLSGRNDILINETKVSGCAFYQLSNRSVLHNSLLFDTQLDHLSNALTPAKEKLQKQGCSVCQTKSDECCDLYTVRYLGFYGLCTTGNVRY